MNRIDFGTRNGIYMFSTVSGSIYILKITDKRIILKRNPRNENSSLRKDNEEIEVLAFMPIEVGKRAMLLLEPLGKGESTSRYTTEVLEIWEINHY
ncbi:hypothetical protein CLOBY_03890 [Clostridium saccharobutylicum]|uniref:hypothetical protein n=1 Tax=Clostridium saccharobutylicum TaxID=169679 RepID=UPI000983FF95|nr:hypothetical protein [Clostridium saccharobutylicum]AQS08317.1 hypothetical protein CLOBY_03890 [Clostridium saccharobutylicum]MBC2435796.1 hypothetical protein [Clostridium saccharobutylicum]NSB88319.1 hypothetical protein [Clostridium saccharobutylicum]NYC29356.1 hypothetical protein [Clostridium saccharobutylicum]OOM10885.1 hypothetical protein CLSAB_42680 [Clostridium saccharobutylicum]